MSDNIEASPGSLPSHRFSGHSLWQPPHMCQTLFSRQCPDPFLDLKSFNKVGASMSKPISTRTFSPESTPTARDSSFMIQISQPVFVLFSSTNLHVDISSRIFVKFASVRRGSSTKKHGQSDKKWVITDENAIKCPSFKSRQSRLGPGWNDPIYRCDLFLPPTVTMEISRPPHRPLASPGILLGSWCSSLFKWPHTLHISTTCKQPTM